MSEVQRNDKPKLSIEEIANRKKILKSIIEQKRAKKIDIKATFDLMYLSFLPLLEDRDCVEKDLKELKVVLDNCADFMLEIIEKSKRKNLAAK